MSGLIEQLATVDGGQVQSAQIASIMDAGIDEVAKLVPPLGTAIGLVQGILNILDPPANSPTIQDLQNQIAAFAATVEQQLAELQATVASGQVKDNAEAIEKLLLGDDGPVSIAGEIPNWRNSPGLPLPVTLNPGQYQIWARSPLLTLLGQGPPAVPPDSRPTAYWWLPVGDLPLFKPANPWTYVGTSKMFDQPDELVAGGLPLGDWNVFTQQVKPGSLDLSAFHFTNDFSPTQVAGIPDSNAFNPTWVLPQSMAAVYYYLLICGAVLQNFPNDGSTIPDFVGANNFAGSLIWYHDQIRAGIVNIQPPFWTDLIPCDSNGLIAASADAGVSQWSVPCATSFFVGDAGSAAGAPTSEWKRPFGALCNYNGYVAGINGESQPSVDEYPNYVYPTPGQSVYAPGSGPVYEDVATSPRNPGSWLKGFYVKYLVACLWRTKLVYRGMGLADMWHTINNLYVMCGQAPQSGPCFGDWSLREVFQMLGWANLETFSFPELLTGGETPNLSIDFSVLAFLKFMNSAAPQPSSPLNSLRAVLQA